MDIITLGIGPGGNIPDLVLTGLGISDNPPPPIPTPTEGGVVLGLAATLAEGVEYSLPPVLIEVTVITSAGTIEVSLDGTTWQEITLDSNKNFVTSAPFIRSIDGDSVVIAKGFRL